MEAAYGKSYVPYDYVKLSDDELKFLADATKSKTDEEKKAENEKLEKMTKEE